MDLDPRLDGMDRCRNLERLGKTRNLRQPRRSSIKRVYSFSPLIPKSRDILWSALYEVAADALAGPQRGDSSFGRLDETRLRSMNGS